MSSIKADQEKQQYVALLKRNKKQTKKKEKELVDSIERNVTIKVERKDKLITI